MSEIELLPCPFCGESVEMGWGKNPKTGVFYYFAECDCGATAGYASLSEQMAADRWNNRAEIKKEVPE